MQEHNDDVFNNLSVVVLAGGLGTRLKSVVKSAPKILAPIAGKPFLDILLRWLIGQGVKHVSFSLGHMAETVIKELLQYKNLYPINISYSVEESPIGTLGGLSLTLNEQNISEAIVINGDTFTEVDLNRFADVMTLKKNEIGLVITKVNNVSRYGEVLFDNSNSVTSFIEKNAQNSKPGWINAGIYYLSESSVKEVKEFTEGGIENDFFLPNCARLQVFKMDKGCFIDIGTPESYLDAVTTLQEFI